MLQRGCTRFADLRRYLADTSTITRSDAAAKRHTGVIVRFTTSAGMDMARRRKGLAARRAAMGYTQEGFAEAAGVERSTAWRWEAGEVQPLPSQRRRISEILQVSLQDLDRLLEESVSARATVQPSRDKLVQVSVPSWDDPDDVLFGVQALRASNIGVDGLEQFEQRVAQVIAEYEHSGPTVLGPPTALLRRRAHQVLRGHQPLRLRYRIYRVTAQLAGLLGYMAVNTGRFRLADAYCLEALELAEEIGDVDLQVWVYGTRSLGAYYAGDYEAAYLHAVRGRELAPDSPQSIRLLANGEARALGQLGDREGTDAALGGALALIERHEVRPELTPCISFAPYGYARVAANAATAYVPLGDTGRVLHYTGDVDPAVEQADSDWSRALVRLDIANALLRQPDPDLEQAVALGRQSLEVCAEHPIRSVWQRARELQQLTVRWSGDPRVAEYADALRAWKVTPGVRAITSEPGKRRRAG